MSGPSGREQSPRDCFGSQRSIKSIRPPARPGWRLPLNALNAIRYGSTSGSADLSARPAQRRVSDYVSAAREHLTSNSFIFLSRWDRNSLPPTASVALSNLRLKNSIASLQIFSLCSAIPELPSRAFVQVNTTKGYFDDSSVKK